MDTLFKIASVPWTKMAEREFHLFYSSLYASGNDEKYFKKMGVDFSMKNSLYFYTGKIFYGKQDIREARNLFVSKGENIGDYAREVTDAFLQITKEYESFLEKLKTVNFGSLSHKELSAHYEEYLEYVYSLIPYAFFISLILEEVAQEFIIKKLSSQVENSSEEYQKLLVSKKDNDTLLEHRSRLHLAELLRSNDTDFDHQVDEHLKKYSWITCWGPMNQSLTKDVLVEAVQKLTEKDSGPSVQKEALVTEERVQKITLDKNTLTLVDVMTENIWIRTYRRELISRGNFLTLPLYSHVAEVLEIPYADLNYIATWEIKSLLRGKDVPLSIEKRRAKAAVVKVDGNLLIVEGDAVDEIQISEDDFGGKTSFIGTPVFKGIASGKVRIVKRREDMENFARGEILVTPTVPTWATSVVEACAGIVTDAGGVLSHTAIIAREFKKPCIIGTKIATMALKDGDFIEVNAESGTVRILNK